MATVSAYSFPPFSMSHTPDVLRTLADRCPKVRNVLEEFDQALTEERRPPVSTRLLSSSRHSTPGATGEWEKFLLDVVCVSAVPLCVYTSLRDRIPDPAVFLGHGAGVNTGMLAAGAVTIGGLVRGSCAVVDQLAELQLSGGMTVLGANRSTAARLCRVVGEGTLSVAMVNSPSQTVVSGATDDIEALEGAARDQGLGTVRLPSPAPLHHRMLEAAVSRASGALRRIDHGSPRIPVYSTAFGRTIGNASDVADPVHGYTLAWAAPADLVSAMEDLQQNFDVNHFVEINASPLLTPLLHALALPGTGVNGPSPGVRDAADAGVSLLGDLTATKVAVSRPGVNTWR